MRALTLMETVLALTIMAVIFAAIMPLFKQIRDNWDSKEAAAETLQNGRILIDHINRNLSKAVKITAVSGPNEVSGYIEFKDNNSVTFRYDVSSSYVEYGQIGNFSNLAGPVSQLQFTCYDANDFNTPTTDVNSIRLVKVQTTLTNSLLHSQDKTLTASVYPRANGNNTGNGGMPLIVYGEENQAIPRYRTLSDSTWSAQKQANTVVSYPQWIVAARCPMRAETVIAVLDNNKDLNVEFFNGFSWTAAAKITNNMMLFSERPFDIAYEQLSGKLVIGHRQGGGSKLFYCTYDGTILSSLSNTSISGAGDPIWIRFVPKPASNEILAVILDSKNDVSALVWNGSGWGNNVLLENDTRTYDDECISAAYDQSGNAMVVWGLNDSDTFQYRKWTGSSWLVEGNGPNLGGGGYVRWLKLAADPAGSQMILGVLDGNSGIRLIVWNGSSWAAPLLVETSAAGGFDRRNFDVIYEPGGTRAIALWGRSGQNHCCYRTWNGSSWSSEQTGPDIGAAASIVQMAADPVGNRIFINILNTNGEIKSMIWDGSSFGSVSTFVSNAGGPDTAECFMMVSLFRNEDVHP